MFRLLSDIPISRGRASLELVKLLHALCREFDYAKVWVASSLYSI